MNANCGRGIDLSIEVDWSDKILLVLYPVKDNGENSKYGLRSRRSMRNEKNVHARPDRDGSRKE